MGIEKSQFWRGGSYYRRDLLGKDRFALVSHVNDGLLKLENSCTLNANGEQLPGLPIIRCQAVQLHLDVGRSPDSLIRTIAHNASSKTAVILDRLSMTGHSTVYAAIDELKQIASERDLLIFAGVEPDTDVMPGTARRFAFDKGGEIHELFASLIA